MKDYSFIIKIKNKNSLMNSKLWLLSAGVYLIFFYVNCKEKPSDNTNTNPPSGNGEVEQWLTKSDGSVLLKKQPTNISFSIAPVNGYPNINIDTTIHHQSTAGFGYTLTGGSAYLINRMNATAKASLLQELFGNTTSSIGVTYLRISMGASDLSPSVFSYDDIPAGQTDTELSQFSLAQDTIDLIPVLQQILTINPNIKILASPWSAPVWMKDNNNSIGGSLLLQYYSVYAQYFIKYISAMHARGINIDAITIQNEPQHGGNNPSMVMSAVEQAEFIKNHLGPAFQQSAIQTKIIIWDHNCDNPNYPITVLNDVQARQYIDGSAFHLYGGVINALSDVHNAFPEKNIYFTEQYTGANGDFGGDLKWHIKNVIIGSMNNWSKNALEWNLASDVNYTLHTPGGCSDCKGAINISGSTFSRNVSYYIVAQISKFVPPGSVRIESGVTTNLPHVVFITPEGRKVMLIINDGNAASGFNIGYNGKYAFASLAAGDVATYIW